MSDAPLIYPRSVWTPQWSDGDISLTGLAVEIYAHHSVTLQLPPTATMEQECAEMRKLEQTGHDRFSTAAAPRFGISYNVVLFPSGRAYQGVSFGRRGAHTDGRNSTVRSLCFAGNYEENLPTIAQLEKAQAIFWEGKGKWWAASAPLRGHRDLKPTACPGKNVYTRLNTIAAPIVEKEDDMPSAEEIAKAVWDTEMPVPPNLQERFGARITMRRAMWADLSRAQAALAELETKDV